METYEIIACILLNSIWIVPFLKEVVFSSIKDHVDGKKRKEEWERGNPDIKRKLCTKCKYCIMETGFAGIRGMKMPERHPTYCKLLREPLAGDLSRCKMVEPPVEFQESMDDNLFPNCDIYISAYGNCYHSTPTCKNIRNSNHLYKNLPGWTKFRHCPICWEIVDNELKPK